MWEEKQAEDSIGHVNYNLHVCITTYTTGQGYQTVLLTKITDVLKFIKDESILLQVIAVNIFPKLTKNLNILEHLLTIKIRLQLKITFLI